MHYEDVIKKLVINFAEQTRKFNNGSLMLRNCKTEERNHYLVFRLGDTVFQV